MICISYSVPNAANALCSHKFLLASKWQLRHDAIEALRSFVESGQLDASSSDCKRNSSSILLVVREQTRGFKESNVNIMKAIIHLFRAICEYCEANNVTLGDWAVNDAVIVCSHKISDKKLTHPCQSLLTATCVVSLPSSVILATLEELQPVKAPIAHEEFLKWFQTFCLEFGAGAMCSSISDIIPFLLKVSFVGLRHDCFASF